MSSQIPDDDETIDVSPEMLAEIRSRAQEIRSQETASAPALAPQPVAELDDDETIDVDSDILAEIRQRAAEVRTAEETPSAADEHASGEVPPVPVPESAPLSLLEPVAESPTSYSIPDEASPSSGWRAPTRLSTAPPKRGAELVEPERPSGTRGAPWWMVALAVALAAGLTLAVAVLAFGGGGGEDEDENPATTEQVDT